MWAVVELGTVTGCAHTVVYRSAWARSGPLFQALALGMQGRQKGRLLTTRPSWASPGGNVKRLVKWGEVTMFNGA